MFSMRIFVVWLLLIQWTLTDGQQIVMTASTQFCINQPMTLSCTYTPAASETVTAFKWTYTGAATFLTLGTTCSVITGENIISVTDSKTCELSARTFTLTFPDASKETITREWCCNVATDTGTEPANPGDCKTAVLVCPNLDNPSDGTIAYSSSTSIGSIATYSCNSGYAVEEDSNTRTCQLDGTWNRDERTCTVSRAGFSAGVNIGIIYGTSWILAIVVLLVIYCTHQERLPWNLCDGLLKNRWIWLLIFISVPFVTFVVAICPFTTKRPGKPTKPVISPQSVSVNVGDKATFTCTSSSTTDQAESGPTMSYTWRRNGVDMKSEGRYMVSGQTLTVTNVVKGDAYDTLFTCLAREGSGLPSDESDPARIVIIGKPTKPVIFPQSVSVNVGDTATFTCTSSSTTYPVQLGLTMIYTWRCNGVDIWSEGRYMVSGQTLTVTKVVKGDASDTFTCLAREGSGLTSDESDSARIVITKPTSWTKWGHYGASESESELILPFNE